MPALARGNVLFPHLTDGAEDGVTGATAEADAGIVQNLGYQGHETSIGHAHRGTDVRAMFGNSAMGCLDQLLDKPVPVLAGWRDKPCIAAESEAAGPRVDVERSQGSFDP